MNLPWGRQHHRRQLLEQSFPPAWTAYIRANVALFQSLSPAEQSRLCDILRILVAETRWEGCAGLVVTKEMPVVIAAQAAFLLLGWGHDYFEDVETVLIYPTDFYAKRLERTFEIKQETDPLAGEAWSIGPVVLSWESVLGGGRNAGDGFNPVFHEFAHKLDQRDGPADGVPPLGRGGAYGEWSDVMSAEYQQLVAATEAGEPTLLRAYGATNAAEFFAVATECFFERPRAMLHSHERLYRVLQSYYRQDPAARPTLTSLPSNSPG